MNSHPKQGGDQCLSTGLWGFLGTFISLTSSFDATLLASAEFFSFILHIVTPVGIESPPGRSFHSYRTHDQGQMSLWVGGKGEGLMLLVAQTPWHWTLCSVVFKVSWLLLLQWGVLLSAILPAGSGLAPRKWMQLSYFHRDQCGLLITGWVSQGGADLPYFYCVLILWSVKVLVRNEYFKQWAWVFFRIK